MASFRATEDKCRYSYILLTKGIVEKVALTSRFLAIRLEQYQALKEDIEELTSEKPSSWRRFRSPFNIMRVGGNLMERHVSVFFIAL